MFKIYFLFFLVSPCDSLSCLNEGSCRVEAGIASCFCKGDYSGTTCEGKDLYTCNNFVIYINIFIHCYWAFRNSIMYPKNHIILEICHPNFF